jgi:hypothetical protein
MAKGDIELTIPGQLTALVRLRYVSNDGIREQMRPNPTGTHLGNVRILRLLVLKHLR